MKANHSEKITKNFVNKNNCANFATKIMKDGSVAQLNRASDYGSEGYRFESCRSHKMSSAKSVLDTVFLCLKTPPHALTNHFCLNDLFAKFTARKCIK